MKNKIGILINSLKLGLKEGIRKSAELGAEGIQFYAVEGDMSPDTFSKAKRTELLDYIKTHGLVISAICGDLGGHGFTIREYNREKIEKSKRIIDFAKEMECDIVTTHIGVIPEKEDHIYGTLLDACYELGEYAGCINSKFAIETGPEKTVILKKFLDELNVKGLGVNYDPANLVMVTGDDPVKGVFTLKDYIVHTHAKDGIMLKREEPEKIYRAFAQPELYNINFKDYFTETPLGEGNVDYSSYLQMLNTIKYSGFVTIERETGDRPEDDIRKAVEFLRIQI